MIPTYRGRFAPSPTGPLHLGSLVAAIGSYCQARSQQGQWLVRIEDLDRDRSISQFSDDILRTLEKYALYWDSQVIYQSRRDAAYREALANLQAMELVFACSCSRREIATIAQAGPLGYIYPGTCRNRSLQGDKPVALRVVTEGYPEVTFNDRLSGPASCNLALEAGDFVIQRADGQFAYQLAVTVDDAEQNITEVVRGADLHSSTPLQIFLQQVLKYQTPGYCHLPLVTNSEGAKLSKQNLAPPISRANPVPELVLSLQLLGQNPDPHLRYGSAEEILQWAVNCWNLDNIPPHIEITLD